MENNILNTKLFIPEARPRLVQRDRLIERLNAGVYRKLSLISAPAGFGKTTLVTEWLNRVGKNLNGENRAEYKISWLSLDEKDNDLVRFLTYLISALRRLENIDKNFGKGALSMLLSTQLPATEAILTTLINDIAVISDKIIFVIDDYHLIEAQPIHDALSFLLENIPPQFHLVITTREDPYFPLARLRAKDQITDIRAKDLRFTPSEAATFLNQVMGLELSKNDIATLEKGTEGWIAGLQLAAISLQGQTDTARFIKSFTGSHRLVIDYLIEEVLNQQPANIQTFLLQTSILDEFNSSLCDALTGQENSQEILEELERSNLFIVPLDNQRHWYRYHHLFSDSLHQRLKQSSHEQVKSLHLKASEWYTLNGFTDQSIEHALLAEEFGRAARLIEEHADACWKRGEHSKLRYWLDNLPEELLLGNPNLCVFQAWEQYASGQQDAAKATLQAVEQSDIVHEVKSESDRLRIVGRIATIWAFLVTDKGDSDAIKKYAQQALDHLPEEDIIWRNTASIPLGDVLYLTGHVEDAARIRLETWETSKAIQNIFMEILASMKYCITLQQQGKFNRIKEICQQQMTLAEENGFSLLPETGWILCEWGEALAEQGDLEQAIKKTRAGTDLARGSHVGMYHWCNLRLITALFSSKQYADLEAIFREVEEYGKDRLPPWIVTEMKARQLRLWLAQDKIEETSQWLAEQSLDITGKPDRGNEWGYLVLVRFLIAAGHPSDTLDLLERLYSNANDRGHITRVIEILNLKALALQAAGDAEQAITVLEQSLKVAEPRGFLYSFVNEGSPMARLLYEALSRELSLEYVQKLLAAFPTEKTDQSKKNLADSQEGLIEPLSERELEVLQLMADGLSRQEIATRLFISINTIKVHTRHIFQKLGVSNKLQAVSKANMLGLLEMDQS